ncbi:hypothetical protein L873DRAFT_1824341 [Choiromyces venosus 120613-1]|uniref:Uncharacterized protein n=1 Tax=Choiromyces venosus 120613-1 TaxID=1336337 RepID=A0A3N4IRJ6_9PEZI|nr:hypothetical protein L873DRAFT_1824341 [Choiromyces venosus 120613-1]
MIVHDADILYGTWRSGTHTNPVLLPSQVRYESPKLILVHLFLMLWISPLEPQNRHQGMCTERFDGVGDWLLEMKEFREWTPSSDGGTDEAVLFVLEIQE